MEASELQEYFKLSQKHEWEIPVELEALWLHTAELSEKLRQKFDSKMSYEEILTLGNEASLEKIQTPEIRLTISYAERAKKWNEKAISLQHKWVTLKTLQCLVNEAKSIPVKIPYCDEVKLRYEKAHEW